MPEQARRHHVVSKFYLRYFANDNERVTTVMLPGNADDVVRPDVPQPLPVEAG